MNSKAYSSSFVQFIALNSFGKLVLNPKATSFIKSLPAPLSIVSMIGPRSSGKSFLLNCLQNEFNQMNHSALQLDSSSNICVSSKPLLGYNQDGKITSILLFDTPGLELQKQSQHKLLILMLLISTSVFYNTKTPFSNAFIEQMKQLTNLLDLFPNFSKHFAKSQFNWIFRDFDKKIQNQFGVAISEKQYFQNYLLSLSNTHDNAVNAIKTFLPQRNCHFFIKPSFEQHDQHPLFWQQVIKLRKSLTDLPSMNIEGPDFILLLSTYIESLNNNDSLQKVIQQGLDCLTRIRCLDRLNDELKSLQQLSMNSIDGIEQKLLDIKVNLNEYFKQRMVSTKQIQALDQELAQIFQEFRQLNEIKSSPHHSKSGDLSPHSLRVKINKPQKVSRYSINIEESDAQRNDYQDKSMLSFTRINTSKAMQSRLQECEAKLYRYQLQTDMIRNQAGYFKQEYEKSRKQLDVKHEQLQQLLIHNNAKQKEYEMKLYQLQEKIKTLEKENLLALSENQKITLLSEDKISYLESEIAELSECYKRESEEREEKYKAKINEYVNEITELNKAHQEEIVQLKLIYKTNMDKMVECNSNSRSDKVIRAGNEPSNNIDQLEQDIAKYKTTIAELETNLASLTQKLKTNEEKLRVQAEKAQKRVKEMEVHLQTLHQNQINEKETIIKELQTKNAELLKRLQQAQNNYHLMSEESNNTIRELRHELLNKSQTSEVTHSQLTKYKNQIAECLRDLQQKTYELSQNKTKIDSYIRNAQTSQKEKNSLLAENKTLKQQIEKLKFQNNLQVQQLHQTIENHQKQNENLVTTKTRQLQELRKLYEIEKQGLLSRMQDLNQQLEITRPYKYHYEDLQLASSEKENQFSEMLMDNQNTIGSLRHQLQETQKQLNKNQQHISFLTNSLADLNEQYSNNCSEYSNSMEDLQRYCSEKINGYIMEITELRAQLNEMKNQQDKLQNSWQKKQKEYQQELTNLSKKCKQQQQKVKEAKSQMNQSQTRQKQAQYEQAKQNSRVIQVVQKSSYRPCPIQVPQNKEMADYFYQNDKQKVVQPKLNISISNIIQTTNNDSINKTAQLQIEKQQLSYEVRLLREKMQSITQKYNNELTAKNAQIKKLQESIATLKNESNQQLLRQRQQMAALRHELKVREAERAVLLQNIDAIQAKHRSDRQKSQNFLNLLQRKMKEVKQENERLTNTLHQYKSDYSKLQQLKRSVEFNYNRDSTLWANKYAVLQQKYSNN